MNRIKLITVIAVIGVGASGILNGCGGQSKLLTHSITIDKNQDLVKDAKKEVIKGTDIVKGGNIINSAKSYAVKASEVSKILANPYAGEEKTIFLTFDDGPSENTDKVTQILEEEGVHATFFVLGNSLESEEAGERLKNTIQKGHAIANHTYTHDYKKLYPRGVVSVETFMKEVDLTNEKMKGILGENFQCNVVRMPGGHMTRKYYNDKNLDSLDKSFADVGRVQLDWTAENGDGITKKESLEKMLNRVYEQTQEQKNIVLLMHDSKGKELTVEALPQIIKHFKEKGYSFKVIANDNI
ncbi:MAG: polysaccharide deacetylase family protein [Sarcina sp.]